jgi:hypothetical protein
MYQSPFEPPQDTYKTGLKYDFFFGPASQSLPGSSTISASDPDEGSRIDPLRQILATARLA